MRIGFIACLFVCTPLAAVAANRPATAAGRDAAARRGEYLVRFGGCVECHTPWKLDPKVGMPVPDMSRLLSGFPSGAPGPEGTVGQHDIALIGPTFNSFKMPFGEVWAPNLTPDAKTGLGNWTEQEFTRALRTGRHRGGSGRPILPPMPWMDASVLSDADLHAIWTYLRSIPAIENQVPAPEVPDEVMASIAKGYDAMLARRRGAPAAAAGWRPASNGRRAR
jgi:mono/diheme cytochrome c family protein